MPSGVYSRSATTRLCAGCGEQFEGRARAKWCSDRCRKQTLYAGVCVDCGAPTNGSNGRAKAGERCARCSARWHTEGARWTREAILDAIREWAERFGRPPQSTEWGTAAARLAAGADARYPWTSVVLRKSGRWNAAIAAAGLQPNPRGSYLDVSLCREVRERYEAGEPTSALAQEYGRSQDTIAAWVRRAGGALRDVNAAKTHCPRGHPYAGENLYMHQGRRHCRACRNAKAKARRQAEAKPGIGPGLNEYGRPIYTGSVLGNAARHVLAGDVTLATLPAIIARCHWCNTVVGRCFSGEPECWHLAARLLLEQGLRPLEHLSGARTRGGPRPPQAEALFGKPSSA